MKLQVMMPWITGFSPLVKSLAKLIPTLKNEEIMLQAKMSLDSRSSLKSMLEIMAGNNGLSEIQQKINDQKRLKGLLSLSNGVSRANSRVEYDGLKEELKSSLDYRFNNVDSLRLLLGFNPVSTNQSKSHQQSPLKIFKKIITLESTIVYSF